MKCQREDVTRFNIYTLQIPGLRILTPEIFPSKQGLFEAVFEFVYLLVLSKLYKPKFLGIWKIGRNEWKKW